MKKLLILISLFLYSPFLMAQTADVEKIPLEKMAKFKSLLGHWNTVQYSYENDAWIQIATSIVTYNKKLKGKLIAEEIHDLMPDNIFIVETLSHMINIETYIGLRPLMTHLV